MFKISSDLLNSAKSYSGAFFSLDFINLYYHDIFQNESFKSAAKDPGFLLFQETFNCLTDQNHKFIMNLKKLNSYNEIINKFKSKRSQINPELRNLRYITKLPHEIFLYGIIAASICAFDRAVKYGPESYTISTSEAIQLKNSSKKIFNILNSKVIGTCIPMSVMNFLENCSKGKVSNGVNLQDHDALISINHKKAEREVFIITFGRLYKKYFVFKSGSSLISTVHIELLTEISTALIDDNTNKSTIEKFLKKHNLQKTIFDILELN